LAVELAVTILFLNTPDPETVCGVVAADAVPFLKFWKLKVEAVWVNVPLLIKLPAILIPDVGILNSPFVLIVNVLIPIVVEEFDTYLFVPEAPSIITLSKYILLPALFQINPPAAEAVAVVPPASAEDPSPNFKVQPTVLSMAVPPEYENANEVVLLAA
jgi:hypothetical protein